MREQPGEHTDATGSAANRKSDAARGQDAARREADREADREGGRESGAVPTSELLGHADAPPAGSSHEKETEEESTGFYGPRDADNDVVRPQLAADRLLGRYQLLRVVGRGGFGEVWQAHDPVLDKNVAVKISVASSSARRLPPTLILQEARKAASLRHPAIVQVYDAGESTDGWYIVSEFVEGESLRGRMTAGRIPLDQGVRVVATVARALHAAHLAGLIHRDVKPGNILLDRAGNAYLTDFGLAVREDEQSAQGKTVAGTVPYMSPEQVRGATHLMDGRADIYSLGVVLYELLTGRRPFQAGDFVGCRELILHREPRPLRSIDDAIPAPLERICLKCLAKEVRDRYATAQDLADELDSWLATSRSGSHTSVAPPTAPGQSASVERPASLGSLASAPRLVKTAVALTVVLAVIGAAWLAFALLGGRFRNDQPPGALEPQQPRVKELVWPQGSRISKWEILPEVNHLKVYSDSMALLQLGQTDADSWELSVTVRQVAGVGRVGVFLGHRKDLGNNSGSFELIKLVGGGDKAYLQRSFETYRLDQPLRGTAGAVRANVRLENPRAENTLRLTVRHNRLATVHLNDKLVPELSDVAIQPPANGPFGVFNYQSDGVFSRFLFNHNPILLAPESPP